jgi:hypothetical protein
VAVKSSPHSIQIGYCMDALLETKEVDTFADIACSHGPEIDNPRVIYN